MAHSRSGYDLLRMLRNISWPLLGHAEDSVHGHSTLGAMARVKWLLLIQIFHHHCDASEHLTALLCRIWTRTAPPDQMAALTLDQRAAPIMDQRVALT